MLTTTSFLAKIAYETPEQVHERWSERATSDFEFLKDVASPPVFLQSQEDAQAYVFVHKDATYVCFRGSSSAKDFMTNVNLQRYELENRPRVCVHRGFLDQYRSIEQEMYRVIRESQTQRVVVCGHSLGGALAQLAAVHIACTFTDVHVACYSFGGPRIGNSGFVTWFAANVNESYRIVHYLDPVPNVPLFPFWQHVQCACTILHNNHHQTMCHKDQRFFARIILFLRTLNPWSIRNHAMSKYLSLISSGKNV